MIVAKLTSSCVPHNQQQADCKTCNFHRLKHGDDTPPTSRRRQEMLGGAQQAIARVRHTYAYDEL